MGCIISLPNFMSIKSFVFFCIAVLLFRLQALLCDEVPLWQSIPVKDLLNS